MYRNKGGKTAGQHLHLAEQLLDRLRATITLSAAQPQDPWFELHLAEVNIMLAQTKINERTQP